MSTDYGLVPVKNRLLFHLLKYNNPKDNYNLPQGLTRKGIAEAICANVDYVCMPLNKYMNDGIIQVRMGHIKFGKRKTRYFTLTQKGNKYAKNILEKLSNQRITLIQGDGSKEKIAFKDIYPNLRYEEAGVGITEQDIYRAISENKTLEIDRLFEMKKMRMVDYTSDTPTLMHFFGRQNELETLKKWIDDKDGPNIIFINGMAGIGKTTLIAKLIEEYRDSKNIFWHNFHQLESPRGILSKLSDFLCRLGSNHLEMYLKMNSTLDYYKISSIMRKDIGFIDSLWIFDDFHKSNAEIWDFINYIRVILNSSSKTKLLIMSREIIPFYDRKDVLLRNNVAELEIEGLDYTSSKQLLKKRGIDYKKYKELYNLTQGNPLFLEFCDSKNDLNRYMHDELFMNIKEDERNILSMISIFRHSIPEEALNIFDGFDFEKLYSLSRNSLVKIDENERFFLHDLIKYFYYKRLQQSKRAAYHLRAAQWYENQESSFEQIEAIYHYTESGNHMDAFSLLEKNHKTIIDNGHGQELLINLESFSEMKMDAIEWAQILMIKGKASNIIGEWRKSLLYFSQVNDIAQMYGNKELQGKALCGSGQILEEQNQFEEAMNNLKTCLKISENIGYEYGKCIALRGIGRILWRKGEHDEAIVNLWKSLEISKDLNDHDLESSTYIDLGNVYDEKYEIKKAIDCYNKSLKISKKYKNDHEIVRAYSNLAVVYRRQENFDSAFKCYDNSISLAKKLQDIKQIGYGYAGLSYCYARINKYKDASEYAKKAEDIVTKIDNKNIMFDVYRANAFISKNDKNFSEAISYLQKSLELLEKIGASYYLPDMHYECGRLFKEMNDDKNAKRHFKIASDFYDKLGLTNNAIVEKLS